MNNQDSQPQLVIDAVSKNYLSEIQKWSKFLSIVGFIGLSLFVLILIIMSFFISEIDSNNDDFVLTNGLFLIVYLLIAALYFPPIYYMYKFSRNMNFALSNDSNKNMVEAFKYLKSQFKFFGIYTIVIIIIYGIGMIGALLFM